MQKRSEGKAIAIYDIVKEAGVSPETVSRAESVLCKYEIGFAWSIKKRGR